MVKPLSLCQKRFNIRTACVRSVQIFVAVLAGAFRATIVPSSISQKQLLHVCNTEHLSLSAFPEDTPGHTENVLMYSTTWIQPHPSHCQQLSCRFWSLATHVARCAEFNDVAFPRVSNTQDGVCPLSRDSLLYSSIGPFDVIRWEYAMEMDQYAKSLWEKIQVYMYISIHISTYTCIYTLSQKNVSSLTPPWWESI